ncbi:JAB domain-containing protein [Segniliparus rotundus]|nr:DNA repair protein RadC [Segniliparus rotundus]
MTTAMRDIPQHDRPRERLLRQGAAALSEAELVAIHLGSGHARASALDVAHVLLTSWGGVHGLARARPEELARTPGVGPAKAARLAAAFAIAGRVDAPDEPVQLVQSSDIARVASRVLGASRTEQVAVLVADARLRLRRTEIVAMGSATACPVPVREILATVLRHDGVAFALAHNHPSGDPTPSAADRALTDMLHNAAWATGLRFLDHIVVAGERWRSAAF